ncbi:hypothetical protein [Chryseobacterium hispalense]|uniref:hypothetical protein n=1 Tax=Chryseobacterium hispalense TaxID=1453492 RepID=UPI00391D4CCC
MKKKWIGDETDPQNITSLPIGFFKNLPEGDENKSKCTTVFYGIIFLDQTRSYQDNILF